MPASWIFLIVLAIAFAGYFLAKSRALASAGHDRRVLHSLPSYYGANAALAAAGPALGLLAVWLIAQPIFTDVYVSGGLPAEIQSQAGERSLAMADIRRVANGLDAAVAQGAMSAAEANNLSTESADVREQLASVGVALGSDVDATTLRLAQQYRNVTGTADIWRSVLVLIVAVASFGAAYMMTQKDFRARTFVERATLALLIAAACVAILTTLGIIFSLIFNTVDFFSRFPADDFFFGTIWQPSFSGRGGASDLGFLPLLWGTMFISVIALAVAVPLGLFSAIYLSEYASHRVRTFAKPLIEVLAGIPTIVYGLFALLIVGPLLLDVFGNDGLLGVNWMSGGTAAMTAGLVMGIMLIPFVSSLSDDIINAVPQAMRDGSLGLGATHSETIRQVILPAALPGIVGAILLAASRAIGETMIVVLGAGAAASLSLNPFEAMTTVTAKIVSQLTGDGEFNSPETLVAFALGMSLFVITLGLNIFALWIVRRYREQFE
ncbi:Phosphate transport system permease protein PstC [Roseivivax sp. THAF40]|uniref:phosphate ABC transporter permease subunit PstC n=1 Tax=unclassified Roseivivax TaxID=2639302 RepID=UPI001267A541|nr:MULTISPECIES: phosphate ABC transporter permease subunit PstC [unclassified Roseivivax]QFS82988.1 Phosphate transport system permease protein PstC [Roseivivax sp. THAF197b]QFT46759.1 Phosphate transport system permease protein PstC [Roseivivax sp. THAF40]